MPLRLLYNGPAFDVMAYVRTSGTSPVAEYLDQLSDRQRKRVDALLKRASEKGPTRNKEQSARLAGEDFFEFKAHQVRVFWCYTPDRQIVLFHGFTKKSNSTPKNEIRIGRQRWQETIDEIKR